MLLFSKPGDRPQLGVELFGTFQLLFCCLPSGKEGLSTESGGWSQGFTPQNQGYENQLIKLGTGKFTKQKLGGFRQNGEIKLLEWRCLVTFPPFQAVALLIFGGSSIENQKEHGNLNHNYLWWWWICSSFLTPLNLYSYDWDLCISESCGRETSSIWWGLTVVPQNFGDAHKKSKEEPCIIGGWGTHSGWFSAIN